MGAYENPQLIQRGREGEILASSIAGAAGNISQSMSDYYKTVSKAEAEKALTVKKLQERKNQAELKANEELGKWQQTQPEGHAEVNKGLFDLAYQKKTLQADSNIALETAVDPDVRSQLLQNIRIADNFLDNVDKFSKSIGGAVATWNKGVKASMVGEPGGYVIAGSTDEEILDNTALVEVLGGRDSFYKNSKIDIKADERGDGVVLNVSGTHPDGRAFNVSINSKEYARAEEAGDSGLLVPVESLDPFYKKSKEDIVDDKGNIMNGYLSQTRETVDLVSKGDSGGGIGKDVYQIHNGQRLQERAIKAALAKQAEITASGIMSADSPSRLRTMIDYSLKQGIGYYDKNFKTIKDPQEQKQKLIDILVDKTFQTITKGLEKTIGPDGKPIYWNPSADIKLKAKEQPKEAKEVKVVEPSYKMEYYNNIITGIPQQKNATPGQMKYRRRADFVENLNKLAGESGKYVTREELFNRFAAGAATNDKGEVVKGKTKAEYAKEKGKDVNAQFKAIYGDGKVYVESGANYFKPIKGYDLDTAVGRIKMALDHTADAGEKKQLQASLKSARLMDWIQANPKKPNETEEQYAQRARSN
jgi:hypothetical protein